ncbi:hypothetical protein E2C01_090939 [Portunus trituberculatus]|uniref:Uncharacterized protein n=1 Tax=Portunus trituberculatus TaxID=210409 RepID=A0A5B7JM78_PORTR|nr:hypothetical protein [Portunus trituberculatus]
MTLFNATNSHVPAVWRRTEWNNDLPPPCSPSISGSCPRYLPLPRSQPSQPDHHDHHDHRHHNTSCCPAPSSPSSPQQGESMGF